MQKIDKSIEVIQVQHRRNSNLSDELFNKKIFKDLLQITDSNDILSFYKKIIINILIKIFIVTEIYLRINKLEIGVSGKRNR